MNNGNSPIIDAIRVPTTPMPVLPVLEEQICQLAIKRLFQRVGQENSWKLNHIRLNRRSTTHGPSFIATGSIKLEFGSTASCLDVIP